MLGLTESNLIKIKHEVKDGRLTFDNVRKFLFGMLIYSGITVGVAYIVANEESTVGWDTLSPAIHFLFYLEAVLFAIHLLILMVCIKKTRFNHKALMLGVVLFIYKAALDPFLTVYMFCKDRGYEGGVLYLIPALIGIGFIMHIIIFSYWVKRTKLIKEDDLEPPKRRAITLGVPFLYFLITTFSVFMRNGGLGNYEDAFGFILVSVLYILMLVGVCEIILAAYGVFRFPSFSFPLKQKINEEKIID